MSSYSKKVLSSFSIGSALLELIVIIWLYCTKKDASFYLVIPLLVTFMSNIHLLIRRLNFWIFCGLWIFNILGLIVFFSSGVLRIFIWFDRFSFTAATFFVISLIFAICSRRTQKPSETFGIRIAATIDYPEIWPIVHSFYSILITGFLPAQFMLIFYLRGGIRFFLCVVLIILPIIIAVIYANVIVKPYEKKAEDELREQIEREQFPMYKNQNGRSI